MNIRVCLYERLSISNLMASHVQYYLCLWQPMFAIFYLFTKWYTLLKMPYSQNSSYDKDHWRKNKQHANFQPNTHRLGRTFYSPQSSSTSKIQDGGYSAQLAHYILILHILRSYKRKRKEGLQCALLPFQAINALAIRFGNQELPVIYFS